MYSENSKIVICLDIIFWLFCDLFQSLNDCLVNFAKLLLQ